jgi:hypothetical protein
MRAPAPRGPTPRGGEFIARTPRARATFTGFVQKLADNDTASVVPMSYLL